jgi:DNA-binding HxlR family transcriptional regulator
MSELDTRDEQPGVTCSDERSRRNTRQLLRVVGDKWSLVVVSALTDGPLRFTELQQRIDGLSHRVLTETLRGLQRDGLVERTAYRQVPPRVEYALSDLGRSLIHPVTGLVSWLEERQDQIEANRAQFDVESVRTPRPSVPARTTGGAGPQRHAR